MKKSILLRIYSIVFLMFLLSACAPEITTSFNTTPKEEDEGTEVVAEVEVEEDQSLAYDEPFVVETEKYSLQIVGIEYDVEVPNYYNVQEGNQTVRVEFILKNESDAVVMDIQRYDFGIRASTQAASDEQCYPINEVHEDYFSSAFVEPFGITKGKLLYEVPMNAILTFGYQQTSLNLTDFVPPVSKLKSNFTGRTADYVFGDVVETDNFHFQVIDVDTRQSFEDHYYKDYEFVYVTVIFYNPTAEEIWYGIDGFYLAGEQGDFMMTFMTSAWYNQAGTLDMNDKRIETLVFERPVDEENLYLRYQSYSAIEPIFVELSKPDGFKENILDPETSIPGFDTWVTLEDQPGFSFLITSLEVLPIPGEVRVYFDMRNDTDEEVTIIDQPSLPIYMPYDYDASFPLTSEMHTFVNKSFDAYTLSPGEVIHEVTYKKMEESEVRITSCHFYLLQRFEDQETIFLNLNE